MDRRSLKDDINELMSSDNTVVTAHCLGVVDNVCYLKYLDDMIVSEESFTEIAGKIMEKFSDIDIVESTGFCVERYIDNSELERIIDVFHLN